MKHEHRKVGTLADIISELENVNDEEFSNAEIHKQKDGIHLYMVTDDGEEPEEEEQQEEELPVKKKNRK
jgi:hypothetical protein